MTSHTPVLDPHAPVDLHLHTVASDGGWTPAELVEHLAARGFRVAAVCDHDTMRSVPEAQERAQRHGILLVPGVEVTTRWDGRQWHLLVYGVDLASPRAWSFARLLDYLADQLWAAAERGIQVLERHGYRLPSLREVVNGQPLRPFHVLTAAIRDGHATNLATAHELTKRYGEAMQVDVPLAEAVELAHRAGGYCVLAHPGRNDGDGVLDAERLDRMLEVAAIDGLEAHYRSHSDDDTARYRAMASDRGLLVSAGSDSHAPGFPVNPKPYPASWIAPLLSQLGIEIEPVDDDPWRPGAPDAEQLRATVTRGT
ncbi:PHP domain-containing protein [Thermalbibacter longus]|uniref:PHP domain-containing protein n=1 Tax=Thermalbibacter longus TaxID=2951981 RepID=UPI0024C24C5A|nr:PHP domain-containing protein [Thermalbibacter longus]